jgi:RNA polymerase sigma-70 factor, ECF subfamily
MSAKLTAVAAVQSEFTARLTEHRGILVKITHTYAFDRSEREDLIQEICLQLWRSYPSYDRQRRFSTWMYRVALNTAISWLRHAQLRVHHDAPLDAAAQMKADTAPDPDERIEWVYRFLRTLPSLDRALLLLYLDDRSYREIADVLGISDTNVGTKINRLKQLMRRDVASAKEMSRGTR